MGKIDIDTFDVRYNIKHTQDKLINKGNGRKEFDVTYAKDIYRELNNQNNAYTDSIKQKVCEIGNINDPSKWESVKVKYYPAFEEKHNKIFKIGYCCEPIGILYPIFIQLTDDESPRKFYVGKNGIYEFQSEIFENVNKETIESKQDSVTEEEKTIKIDISIKQVYVPDGVEFVLDYVEDEAQNTEE